MDLWATFIVSTMAFLIIGGSSLLREEQRKRLAQLLLSLSRKLSKNKFKKKAVVINRNKSRLRGCIKTITAAINRTKDEDIINEWRYILSEIKLGLGIFD